MLRLAAQLGCALVIATVVRSTTVALSDSLGRVWPFSLDRCVTVATPGCRPGVVAGAAWRFVPPA